METKKPDTPKDPEIQRILNIKGQIWEYFREDSENVEVTFVIIKPDGVKDGKESWDIMKILEKKGLKMIQIKSVFPTEDVVREHYIKHKGKDFYDPLCKFMCSGPVFISLWVGKDAVRNTRDIIELIRKIYSTSIRHNRIHGSDSHEEVARETKIWGIEDEYLRILAAFN